MAERGMNLLEVVRQRGDDDLSRQQGETTLAKRMEFEVVQHIATASGGGIFPPFWNRGGCPSGPWWR